MSTKPTKVVKKLLANTLNPDVVRELVAPDATYISLNYENPDLTKILPYAGTHAKDAQVLTSVGVSVEGPQAIIETFATVNTIWANEAFEVQALFGGGKNVAVFGKFTYRSRTLGKANTSMFSIWCKVNGEMKVTHMTFMEDTYSTTNTFTTKGKKSYKVFEAQREFEV